MGLPSSAQQSARKQRLVHEVRREVSWERTYWASTVELNVDGDNLVAGLGPPGREGVVSYM